MRNDRRVKTFDGEKIGQWKYHKFLEKDISYLTSYGIAQERVNGSYKFQIEKVKIKGFAPKPCISLSSGA